MCDRESVFVPGIVHVFICQGFSEAHLHTGLGVRLLVGVAMAFV